jgi:hypothetical protein
LPFNWQYGVQELFLTLHGTGSNHTQVSWNGIPLNSPTSGQVDLSPFQAASCSLLKSLTEHLDPFLKCTFGGVVNLMNEPDWNNRLMSYSFNAGSFTLQVIKNLWPQ